MAHQKAILLHYRTIFQQNMKGVQNDSIICVTNFFAVQACIFIFAHMRCSSQVEELKKTLKSKKFYFLLLHSKYKKAMQVNPIPVK